MIDYDVVVVGAGPIGLMLANLLGVHGMSTLVIERNAAPADAPRAVALDDEGMRTLQLGGLDEAVSPHMLLGYDHRLFGRNGQLLLEVNPAGREHGYAKRNRFHQPILEKHLLAGIARFADSEVRFGAALTGFEAADDDVVLTVDGSAGLSRLRTRFLVGCDGGNSTVRRLAGIKMLGESHPESWIVIDTENNPDNARFSRAIGDPRRPSVNVPGTEGRRRYEFMLLPGEDPEEAVSAASVARLLAPHCDPAQVRIVRQTVYSFHSLVADRFSVDRRIFLAGDAAHMMPPFQGQGMNSGMRDAALLAWRLAAVVDGQLGASVLDSYETERLPHAREMILLSQRVGRVLMTHSHAKARLRDLAFKLLSRLPATGSYLREMRFKPRPVAKEGFFVPGQPGAGRLFPQPDVMTRTGRRVRLDDVLGAGFALLMFEDSIAEARGRWTHPFWSRLRARRVVVLPGGLGEPPAGIDDVIGDLGGDLRRASGAVAGEAVLLRPDRYVAALLRRHEEAPVAAALDALAPIEPLAMFHEQVAQAAA